MKKIAVVIPQFDENNYDGADIHARLLINQLKTFANITVITTSSIPFKKVEIKQGLKIIYFPRDNTVNTAVFNSLSLKLFTFSNHTFQEEKLWLRNSGTNSAMLIDYLRNSKDQFNNFFFIGYNHAITCFGLPVVKKKAILVPLAHKEPLLRFKIYRNVFYSPLLILPSSYSEKELLKKIFPDLPPLFILGINTEFGYQEKPVPTPVEKPYLIYLGRISHLKGVFELIEYFREYKSKKNNNLKLILTGINKEFISVPRVKGLILRNYVTRAEKHGLLSNAEFLINPSYYESLSLILLESWQEKKAVLVNGKCEALKSQVKLSKGGLSYYNYAGFESSVSWLLSHPQETVRMGLNGYHWYNNNYSRKIIKKKLKVLLECLN